MQWYQVVAIILMIIPVGYHLAKNGQNRFDKYSVWDRIINASIWAGILYAGGFWS